MSNLEIGRCFRAQKGIDLYEQPQLDRLATQMAAGRFLRLRETCGDAYRVQLCEDGYEAFLAAADWVSLVPDVYVPPPPLTMAEIRERLAGAIAYGLAALAVPNVYVWGGTLPPNFDCSGLVQAAFAAVGIWLPRDAYQQEGFTMPVTVPEPGDLVFFGGERATHVGLWLGDGRYLHSSGPERGHNGLAIDLWAGGTPVSDRYRAEWRGFGRVTRSGVG
ncbi:MAG: C40 family peptidase [Pseudanabaenaceae cyanobacterium]